MNPGPENPNQALLLTAAQKLAPLLGQIVFVGGCVTGLLITEPGSAQVRPTLDVDVIVEAATYAEFTLLEQQLRNLGFRESRTEGDPICRWRIGDLILDFMPVDPSILGFSNRWYRPAWKNAQKFRVGDHEIRLITAPYFLATKLEAFHGRAKNDFRARDLDDVVTVIDGRPGIIDEFRLSPHDLRNYLSDEFRDLLSNRDFLEALPGHLLPDAASQRRAGLVLARMSQLILED